MHDLNKLGAAVCLLALGACAATASPDWDARFGDSVRILKAQQLIEPGAAQRNATRKRARPAMAAPPARRWSAMSRVTALRRPAT